MRIKTIIEAIAYILDRVASADKIQIIKWIYLADKYHLVSYGRTITGDKYYAMQYGPVGSKVKDVLERNQLTLSKSEINDIAEVIETMGGVSFKKKDGASRSDFDYLSETDREALDFILEKFGKMSPWELRDYTHKYPEWKQHEQRLKTSGREDIKPAELFSLLKDDTIKITSHKLKTSKEIFSGTI